MKDHKRAVVVATRVNKDERVLLETAAALDEVSVCKFIYRAVMPAVFERVTPTLEAARPQVTG